MAQVTASTDSVNITTLDTIPLQQLTAGEGKPGTVKVQDDYIHVTTAMLAAGQNWRLARIPTTAKVKKVEILFDAIPDTNSTQTLALDFNMCFSDATNDGTSGANQAQIPTTANTGATTSISSYSNPNKLFGTLTLSGNDAFAPVKTNGFLTPLDITFGGGSVLYNSMVLTETPLWELFGFTNAQGLPCDPGGYFDFDVNVSTAAATAAACNFFVRITYVD